MLLQLRSEDGLRVSVEGNKVFIGVSGESKDTRIMLDKMKIFVQRLKSQNIAFKTYKRRCPGGHEPDTVILKWTS